MASLDGLQYSGRSSIFTSKPTLMVGMLVNHIYRYIKLVLRSQKPSAVESSVETKGKCNNVCCVVNVTMSLLMTQDRLSNSV